MEDEGDGEGEKRWQAPRCWILIHLAKVKRGF